MSTCREEKRGEEGKREGGNGEEERVRRNRRTEPRLAPTFNGWGDMEDLSLRKGFHTNRVRSRGMWYPRSKNKKIQKKIKNVLPGENGQLRQTALRS